MEKYFIVKGSDTRAIKEDFKKIGGRFNWSHKGWTFKIDQLEQVKNLLKSKNFIVDGDTKNNIKPQVNLPFENCQEYFDDADKMDYDDFLVLPDPDDLNDTDCGRCYNCVQMSGKCLCPLVAGSYKNWYLKKKQYFNAKNNKNKVIDEKLDLLNKLSKECFDMENSISGDEFKDMDIETLKDIVKIGNGDKKRCYLLETMYQYIESMIKQNKKDKIVDPIDGTKLDENTINYIIKKYQENQLKKGNKVKTLKSDYVKIDGCNMSEPFQVVNKLSGKAFTKLQINRKGMLPFVVGYLPNDYETPDADLQIYALIGTIADIFNQNKMFTNDSTIDNLILNKAFDIIKLTPKEVDFLNDYNNKIKSIDLKTKAGYNKWIKLANDEDKKILNPLLNKWWKINPYWKHPMPIKERYIFRIELLDNLMRELTYLKYN